MISFRDLTEMMSADIFERKLYALECPFTWKMPDIVISPNRFLETEVEKRDKIKEEGSFMEFNWTGYPVDIGLAYEFYRTKNDIETGLKYAASCIEHLEDLVQRNCQEQFFSDSKNALLHVALATKAYLLAAGNRIEEAKSVVDGIVLMDKITTKEKAAIYGIKASVFLEYGMKAHPKAIKIAKKACKINPTQGEWHFIVGTATGRIRRAMYKMITNEEVEELETANSLEENPFFIVHLAQLYSEMSSTIYHSRNRFEDREALKESRRFAEMAIDKFKKAVALGPNSIRIKARAAHCFIRVKPIELVDKVFAKQLLDDVLEKSPNNCFIHHDLGYYYDKFERNIEEAIKWLDIAQKLVNVKAFVYLITLKWKCGRRDEILKDLEKAMEQYVRDEDQIELLAHIVAFTLLIKDDWKTALSYANKCLKLDPEGKFFVEYLSKNATKVNLIQMMRHYVHTHTLKDATAEADEFLQLSQNVDLHTCRHQYFYKWKEEQLKVGQKY